MGGRKYNTNKLRSLRAYNKLKQVDMAEILGMSEASYSRKESGKSKFTLEEAWDLSQYFNTIIDKLFFEESVA